jgi:hypothetical protein
MTMTFEGFMEFVKQKTLKSFEKNGMLLPVFLIVNKEYKLSVVMLNDLIHLGKEEMSNILREYCSIHQPLYTAHVSEANVLRFNKQGELEKHLALNKKYTSDLLKPSVHPDKEDMVILSFCSSDGGRYMTSYRIVDPIIAKKRLVCENTSDLLSDTQGLFANII